MRVIQIVGVVKFEFETSYVHEHPYRPAPLDRVITPWLHFCWFTEHFWFGSFQRLCVCVLYARFPESGLNGYIMSPRVPSACFINEPSRDTSRLQTAVHMVALSISSALSLFHCNFEQLLLPRRYWDSAICLSIWSGHGLEYRGIKVNVRKISLLQWTCTYLHFSIHLQRQLYTLIAYRRR